MYYFNSGRAPLDYTKYYEILDYRKYYEIYISKNIRVLKHKLESGNGMRCGEEEWKQFIGNLADSTGPKMHSVLF